MINLCTFNFFFKYLHGFINYSLLTDCLVYDHVNSIVYHHVIIGTRQVIFILRNSAMKCGGLRFDSCISQKLNDWLIRMYSLCNDQKTNEKRKNFNKVTFMLICGQFLRFKQILASTINTWWHFKSLCFTIFVVLIISFTLQQAATAHGGVESQMSLAWRQVELDLTYLPFGHPLYELPIVSNMNLIVTKYYNMGNIS